jgi:hypothetical protein
MKLDVRAEPQPDTDRHSTGRGAGHALDHAANERERREQQVVRYLRKQEPK